VNVFSAHVRHPDLLIASIENALSSSGLPPHRLELGFDERALSECEVSARAVFAYMQDRGVRAVLSGFGTGNSSLSIASMFPFVRYKFDGGFVESAKNNATRRAVVEAVCSLGAKLGIDVVAEGMETDTDVEFARAVGITHAQGTVFGRPQPSRYRVVAFPREDAVAA
jgi:EAL domain-containing protein (putative c-di-GMP-specific phosphodiesterase class I)